MLSRVFLEVRYNRRCNLLTNLHPVVKRGWCWCSDVYLVAIKAGRFQWLRIFWRHCLVKKLSLLSILLAVKVGLGEDSALYRTLIWLSSTSVITILKLWGLIAILESTSPLSNSACHSTQCIFQTKHLIEISDKCLFCWGFRPSCWYEISRCINSHTWKKFLGITWSLASVSFSSCPHEWVV